MIGLAPEGPLLAAVRAEGFRVITHPFVRRVSPSRNLASLAALTQIFRAEKPDLVHAHMPLSGFLGRLAAWRAGVPRIAYTCHGFLFRQPGPWPRRAASLAMEWLGGRVTGPYLTVSEADAGAARRFGIAREACAVGNGRDPAVFHPDAAVRARVRAEIGTAPTAPVVLIVGRLVRHKGYPELLQAMAQVPDAELWVAGEHLRSDRGSNLRAMFAQAGLGARLKMLGYRDDVPALLAAADILALPSHFEGLPMVVIEAMLAALPVVASDIPGPREQIVPEVTGLLVPRGKVAPLAAALRALVADPERRIRMGQAGRERAIARYDEAKVLARTLDLLGL